ncbi:MAG: DUF4249 domain-containing protein [Bacteroidales bacterium]|jgi:hypothetical protein|nr:DUF4249 domain-containing protein [Bacteroidales bacterium]
MKRTSLLILIAALSWHSCTDEDAGENIEPRLVVEAFITSDTTVHKVYLSKSFSIGQDSIKTISGADVWISDDEGNRVAFTEMTGAAEGIYFSPPGFFIRAGKKYQLHIDLDEPVNGYTSYTAESMSSYTNPIDSVKLKFHPTWGENGVYEVQCFYQDPATHEFYMSDILVNQDLVTYPLTGKIVVEDALFNGSYAYGIAAGFLDQAVPSEQINAGDTVTLQLSVIDEKFAKFIWGVQEEAGLDNPFFGNPAANVYSNINNGAIGYFACCYVTRSSVILY